jgi:thioredoxin 1
MALHITDANFKEVLANNAVVVVDFGAAWCGPCKSLSPVIDKIATAYEGRAAVGKVDIEESPETTEEFAIRSVPTILFFKNGEMVPGKKIVGATNEAKITAIIDEIL